MRPTAPEGAEQHQPDDQPVPTYRGRSASSILPGAIRAQRVQATAPVGDQPAVHLPEPAQEPALRPQGDVKLDTEVRTKKEALHRPSWTSASSSTRPTRSTRSSPRVTRSRRLLTTWKRSPVPSSSWASRASTTSMSSTWRRWSKRPGPSNPPPRTGRARRPRRASDQQEAIVPAAGGRRRYPQPVLNSGSPEPSNAPRRSVVDPTPRPFHDDHRLGAAHPGTRVPIRGPCDGERRPASTPSCAATTRSPWASTPG